MLKPRSRVGSYLVIRSRGEVVEYFGPLVSNAQSVRADAQRLYARDSEDRITVTPWRRARAEYKRLARDQPDGLG